MKKEYPKRPPTNENLYDYFLSRVKSNLHVVLCFSPVRHLIILLTLHIHLMILYQSIFHQVGEKFRSRSMKFPGLISGCTIDWFSLWPHDALVAVAKHFISDFEIKCTPEMKKGLYNVMGSFQV